MSAIATEQQGTDFLVRRDDLRQARLEQAPLPAPGDSQILCRVERFALTANNITYALFGEQIGYWRFFPAPSGWGRIPVWGYARVLESAHPQLAAGERLFGYMPMSRHALFTVGKLDEASLIDAAPHRAELPPTYNRYQRLPDAPRDDTAEAHQALLRPLFMLGFMVADFLDGEALFGARRVILSSASSKTALGLAQLLHADRPSGCEVVGLTSSRNAEFVRRSGYYDRVATYQELDAIADEGGVVFVDMAGNAEQLAAVHRRFGAQLRHSCLVGATHWERRTTAPAALPGPAPRFFFAPDHMRRRIQYWGRPEFERRFAEKWQRFLGTVGPWLRLVERQGAEAVLAAYQQVLAGTVDPAEGFLLSL
jgi:hypothetical protein